MARASSPFFAYISRLRWIKRWSLMRNTIEEDVATHCWEVATLAHGLGIIHNRLLTHSDFTGSKTPVDVNALTVAALYHDASEVITGDMPTPVKYYSPTMRNAYKEVEQTAEKQLLALLPDELQPDFQPMLISGELPENARQLLKAADRLSAWLKCRAEIQTGNQEFFHAERRIFQRLETMNLPAVNYFLAVFADAYSLSLDHLLSTGEASE